MKKIFILLVCLITFFTVRSQSYTWTNLDNDNIFENPNNWTPTPTFGYPTSGENVIFDGTVTSDNCIMTGDNDPNMISILSSYGGTVDASAVELYLTNFSQQGGTFIAPSSTLHVTGNIVKGGTSTFLSGATSWLSYNMLTSVQKTINGSFNFQNLEITSTGVGNRIINFAAGTSSCANLFFSAGASPMAYRGTINVTSMLTVSGTALTAAATNTGVILFSGSGAKTIIGTGSPLQNPIGNITFNTAGAVSVSGNITIASTNSASVLSGGKWTVTNIGSFTQGTSLVTMLGGTVTAGTTSSSQAFFDNLSTTTGSTTVFSGNSFVSLKGNLTNNGNITFNNSLLRLSGNGAQSITSAATLSLNALEINNTGTKTLSSPVEISDSLKISAAGALSTGGNLTIKSTNTLKGRIAEIAAGGSISGAVTAEIFALGGSTGWALLGAGGISGQTMNNWYGQFPMALEGSATGVTSAGGYFESVQGWDETDAYGYDTTITTATGLTPGKGFWTYLGTGQTTTSDILITLTGSPVTGNVNIPLTMSAQSGTNLIANPYDSPISWTALRAGNASVSNATYIYNADGPYVTFVNGVGTNGGSDIIAAGQGFYVECSSGTNLTAQEANKRSNNTGANQLLRTNNTSNAGLPIKLKLNGFSADYDETAIRFHGSATNAYDNEWDARKIFQTPGYVGYPGGYSKYTTISTKGGNLDYSINSLPYALTQNAVIPVLVKVMTSGQYTITGQDMQLLPANACATLKDKLLNVTHNIKASPYVFTINDTTSHARFELTICADITTGINSNSTATNIDESIKINDDANGVFVNLNFDKTTKSRISVTNILGQKIIADKFVNTQSETVYFGLEAKNQLIFVTVETDNNKVTKKVIH